MKLFVGKQAIRLPSRPCEPEDVRREVKRCNPPFVVHTPDGNRFSAQRRVFLETDGGLRVECENDAELRFACKLSSEDHNAWHMPVHDESTEEIEAAVAEHMAAPPEEEDAAPKEEEDITIQEWEQLGYRWFGREDVLYI